MRILILIVIGLLLYLIISKMFRKNSDVRSQSDLGKMVQCKHCKLHILQQEAIRDGSNYFCSQQHLEAEQKR